MRVAWRLASYNLYIFVSSQFGFTFLFDTVRIFYVQLFILDQPTLGLDPANRREMWLTIAALQRIGTVVLSTHDPEEADILCDRVVVIARGAVVCSGSTAFLKTALGRNICTSLIRRAIWRLDAQCAKPLLCLFFMLGRDSWRSNEINCRCWLEVIRECLSWKGRNCRSRRNYLDFADVRSRTTLAS